MNLSKKIFLSFFILLLIAAPQLDAQTWEEREEQKKPERHWFWEWLFDDINEHSWGSPSEHRDRDIYDGIVLKSSFTKHWKFSIGDNEKWINPNYDDQYWESVRVPSDWENEGFHGYDGFAWYRIHFNGADLNKDQTHFLVLGQIDDVDETYFNGELIGKSGKYPPPFRTAYNLDRKYAIPAGRINFEGDNVVAVRVYDDGLSGGIVHGKPGIYATLGSEELLQDLYGQWKFSRNNYNSHSRYNFDDFNWDNILVPSFWDNQGHRSLDGIAWYRKHFDICFDIDSAKDYYLVLGNIDDFDITYLNGQEIGRTDDGLEYGRSESYRQMRIYKIPKGLLKPLEDNVIAVKVYDIGNEGGIYRGPIGIISDESLTKMMRFRN